MVPELTNTCRYGLVCAFVLLSSSLTTQAQILRDPRSCCSGDWRLELASRAALLLLRARQSPPQNPSPRTAPDPPAAQTGASGSARDAMSMGTDEGKEQAKSGGNEAHSGIRQTALNFTPAQLLAMSRTIFVRSHSAYVRRKSIEDSLMKKKGFLELGYVVVKDEADADLLLEVDHTALTLRYPFTVTHRKTQVLVASGTVHSLRLLNDVPGDTAASFVKQAKAARTAGATRASK